MAYSSSEGKQAFKDWAFHMMAAGHIKSIFDVGAGAGTYSILCREAAQMATQYQENLPKQFKLHCSEIYIPYIQEHSLKTKYHEVFEGDIVNIVADLPHYDLFIMGDVLEHITKTNAMAVVHTILNKSKFLWLSVPTKKDYTFQNGYNQHEDEWKENPANEHLYEWSVSEMEALLSLGQDNIVGKIVFPVVTIMIIKGADI